MIEFKVISVEEAKKLRVEPNKSQREVEDTLRKLDGAQALQFPVTTATSAQTLRARIKRAAEVLDMDISIVKKGKILVCWKNDAK